MFGLLKRIFSDEVVSNDNEWAAKLDAVQSYPKFHISGYGCWVLTKRGVRQCNGQTLGGTGYGHPLSGHYSFGDWHYNIDGQPLYGAPEIISELKPEQIYKHPMTPAMRVYVALEFPEIYKLTRDQCFGLQQLLRGIMENNGGMGSYAMEWFAKSELVLSPSKNEAQDER